ncbi:MAG: polar amino acid transport system substrate-binding protein [Acidimicrobiaceae bacterium]|jgi:polar amino acid transport system substrate-binding protein|nr:polar amino acid transport system substrate-binding protein [Acidimicrobiaceae bacterium]MDQ1366232.1 polar amino acid transport system substrate-binding protein [Acidimicrobiaceae bacterium]MDQ1367984.1 polar amino acid transport system substrate-binding protein [Acidimicrobiaceae bacterium]MDQ1378796.1 polar amino acid transport system substrate-binding protein [Acidimicrobiaceae bacterium]MDQ1416075.1 polar amino acid transport system substrate-binding protein [Acidimicrobiaceae bacterium
MRWFAGLAVVTVLAAGCASSGTKSASSTVATAKKDAAAVALVPAAVRSKGAIAVALDATYAPDEFLAADGHTVTGMDADLAQAIGHVLGLTVNLQNATFDTIIPGLLSGKFDLGASSFTDTKEREKQVDFVTYFSSGEGFYVASGNKTTFDGLDSLCGHNVAVESGTTEQSDAEAQVKACQSAGKPADNVLVFQDQNAANLAVSTGRAEVGFVDSQVAAYIVQQSKGQFKVSGQPFATAPYGLALPKNGMAAAVLAALKDLMASGVYTKVVQNWNVQSGAITNPVINGATS